MLWRLPPSIHSFLLPNCRRYRSTKSSHSLKILFCGSDEFSIASLRALNDAKQTDPSLIESIDVIHRPGKRTGRGLKVVREVPIKQVATEELELKTHVIDTFTGWTSPSPFDIIIAVSFGLFVPPRILNATKYGGLNVHPSLLPDLRGPAPIHHTLLKKRARTGVTVQTLHPKHFDQGMILAQTPVPGIDVAQGTTVAELTHQLGKLGGQALVEVLRDRTYVPPLKETGWYAESGGPIGHAEKITPAHREVHWSTMTAEQILTRSHVLGRLWCLLPNGTRLILNEIIQPGMIETQKRRPGLFIPDQADNIFAQTTDGAVLQITRFTVADMRKGTGTAYVKVNLEHAQ